VGGVAEPDSTRGSAGVWTARRCDPVMSGGSDGRLAGADSGSGVSAGL